MNRQGINTRNLAQYTKLHERRNGRGYGRTSEKLAPILRGLGLEVSPSVILDYGCGQSELHKSLASVAPTFRFDPAIPGLDVIPEEFFGVDHSKRLVVCSHVLEHLDLGEIPLVLRHLAALGAWVAIVVPTTRARQVLPNGENAHATVRSANWWARRLSEVWPGTERRPGREASELIFTSWGAPRKGVSRPESPFGDLEGKRVAVVGRAASLRGSGEGALIDSFDVVVRVNSLPPPDPNLWEDLGKRTDLLYTCVGCSRVRREADNLGIHHESYDKSLRHSLSDLESGYTPFTGTVAVFEMLQRGAALVYATGMDLYTGASLSGRGGRLKLTQRSYKFHDPNQDAKLLRDLMHQDPRFRPSPRLLACLTADNLTHFTT
jgi:hypothetical protein